MKRYYIIGILICMQNFFAFANSDLENVQSLLENEKYIEVNKLLKKLYHNSDISDSLKLEAAYYLAVFNQKHVGYFREANKYYTAILEDTTHSNRGVLDRARKGVMDMEMTKEKYRIEDMKYERIKEDMRNSRSKKDIEAVVDKIIALIEARPDYYRLGELYFSLGQNYSYMRKFNKSYKAYQKSLEAQPAIDFAKPVSAYLRDVKTTSNFRRVVDSVWTVILVLTLVTMVLFYISKPWKWLKLRHLLVGAGIVVLWYVFFTVAGYINGAIFEPTEEALIAVDCEKPTFTYSIPGGPGAYYLKKVLKHGLVAIVGIFVFSLGIASMKKRKLAKALTIVFAALLFTSTTSVFFLRNCFMHGIYYSKEVSLGSFLTGQTYFWLKGPTGYVLKDPKSFENLNLTSLDLDPELVKFIRQNCKMDDEVPVE